MKLVKKDQQNKIEKATFKNYFQNGFFRLLPSKFKSKISNFKNSSKFKISKSQKSGFQRTCVLIPSTCVPLYIEIK